MNFSINPDGMLYRWVTLAIFSFLILYGLWFISRLIKEKVYGKMPSLRQLTREQRNLLKIHQKIASRKLERRPFRTWSKLLLAIGMMITCTLIPEVFMLLLLIIVLLTFYEEFKTYETKRKVRLQFLFEKKLSTLCPNCGYDRQGIESEQCPECGS